MEVLLSFKDQITEHLWCSQGLFECELQQDW